MERTLSTATSDAAFTDPDLSVLGADDVVRPRAGEQAFSWGLIGDQVLAADRA